MMQQKNIRFFLIDDDDISNMISELIIKHSDANAEIRTFSDPAQGIKSLAVMMVEDDWENILFLDINMPLMSGWEVLESIEKMGAYNQQKLRIFLFSSSVDNRDTEKMHEHPLVEAYIEKPLTRARVKMIINGEVA